MSLADLEQILKGKTTFDQYFFHIDVNLRMNLLLSRRPGRLRHTSEPAAYVRLESAKV